MAIIFDKDIENLNSLVKIRNSIKKLNKEMKRLSKEINFKEIQIKDNLIKKMEK